MVGAVFWPIWNEQSLCEQKDSFSLERLLSLEMAKNAQKANQNLFKNTESTLEFISCRLESLSLITQNQLQKANLTGLSNEQILKSNG